MFLFKFDLIMSVEHVLSVSADLVCSDVLTETEVKASTVAEKEDGEFSAKALAYSRMQIK